MKFQLFNVRNVRNQQKKLRSSKYSWEKNRPV